MVALLWIGGCWACLGLPSVVVMAVASHHIGRYMKKQYKTAMGLRDFQPSMETGDIMLARTYRYAFGFVFANPKAFWRLVYSITRGQQMQPIQRWMKLWLTSHLALIGLGLLWLGFIIHNVFA